jgi:hypothetical protein
MFKRDKFQFILFHILPSLRVIIFGLVQFLLIKTTKSKFWKKNKNQTEPNSNQPVSVRFCFLCQKQKKNLYFFLTSKSHKIKLIFITNSLHNIVESIPAFSQANGLLQNHKNTSLSHSNQSLLTVTNPETYITDVITQILTIFILIIIIILFIEKDKKWW